MEVKVTCPKCRTMITINLANNRGRCEICGTEVVNTPVSRVPPVIRTPAVILGLTQRGCGACALKARCDDKKKPDGK